MALIKGGLLDRRGFLKTTAATVAAASLPLGAARAAPKRGGHLRVGLGHGQTTDTLNPSVTNSGFMIPWSYAVHGRLTEIAPDGSLLPELAESWEASEDASEWRFKIRKGVQFHDGQELTIQDVVNSINFHRGEDAASVVAPFVAPVQEIATEGDDTVVFKLKGGSADFPFILSDVHMSICKADGDSIDWQSGNGCGAYKNASISFGVSAVLERHENHWRDDVAFFDSVEMLALIDLNARTTALISGDVDAIDRVDLKTAGLLGRKPGVNVHSVSGKAHYSIPMDVRKAPYDDNNVRQALKYGINRQEMVEKILFGYGSVGNDHPLSPGEQYFNSELEQRQYDPDKAKWYLQQSDIDNLQVNLSAADQAFAGAVDAAVLFQASAKAANIDINVIREPNDGYWSDVWLKKEFVFSYWGGRPVPDLMFSTAYECGASWNESHWCNERFDDLLVKARAELDKAKRREMYWEMQEICATDGGTIIPMFNDWVFAVNDKLGLPEVMGSDWGLDGNRFMERWWFA